jgi:hypothetical protein
VRYTVSDGGHHVDQGYTSGASLAHSAERGIELMGPVSTNTSGKPEGYRQSDFELDFETHQATCPEGKTSVVWYERPQPDGHVGAEIQFREQCDDCSVCAQCVLGQNGRTLNVNPYHEELSQRRTEQETRAFKEKMKRRPAVEGTISELTRSHGAQRARYRGQDKVRLQMMFTGAAANLKRLARAMEAQKQATARVMAEC